MIVKTAGAKLSQHLQAQTGTLLESHMSNEKNLGWLGYIGDYTTQLYRDYNKPL